MIYDRDAALKYARKYWITVASDGYIAGTFPEKSGGVLQASAYVKVPPLTVFVHDDGGAGGSPSEHALLPNGNVLPWSSLDDCTHFMSCVLGQPPGALSGGLALPSDFPGGPYGVLGADRFVKTLRHHHYVEEIVVDDKAKPGLDRIAPGDLIGYYKKREGRFGHLALYAGNENIICHTYCRSDDPACTWDHRYALGEGDHDWEWRLLRVRA